MDEFAPGQQLPLPKTTPLSPKDHAEAVAIFRSTIVGALTTRELDHGEPRPPPFADRLQAAGVSGPPKRPGRRSPSFLSGQ